ncbi:hypothetical protein SO694_00171061 [Aureococcus anophagefferens]|uniref:Uncharacterized protein n=1 Tax=Aureococcus anophagefferens TaxID=44056 RepID=A0ABR1FZB4_AURAN
MDDDDGDGDDPTIIIDVSAWPRVSFARAEERLFEADGAPAASFDAAGARGRRPTPRRRGRARRRRGAWTAAPMEDGAVDAARAVAAADGTAAAAARAVVDAVRAFPENALATTAASSSSTRAAAAAAGVAAALADVAPGCYKVAVRAAPPGAALRGAFWLDHFARRGAGGGYLAREAFDDLVAGPDGAAGLARRFVDY